MALKRNITVNNLTVNYNRQDFLNNPAKQQAVVDVNKRIDGTFKRDLLMFAEGDLFTDSNIVVRRDLKIVGYVYNYAQQITHRLMTDRGTLPEDRTYGVPWSKYLGKTYSNASIVLVNLQQDIESELHRDNRTQMVNYVRLSFTDPNTIRVETSVTPVFANEGLLVGLSVGANNG